MKVSISKAHKMTGVARSTIYKDIDEGMISVEIDSRGKKLIDTSELSRVYGSLDTSEIEDKNNEEKLYSNVVDVVERSDDDTKKSPPQIAVLQERIKIEVAKAKAAEELAEIQKNERKREREQLQERIDALEENLKQSLNTQNNLTTLLEDKREEGAAPWKKEIESLKETYKNDNDEKKLLKEKLKQFEKKQEEETLQIRKKIKLYKKELPERLKRLEGQGADISLLELEMKEIISIPVANNFEELKEIHADLWDLAKRIKTESIRHKEKLEVENKKSFFQKLFG